MFNLILDRLPDNYCGYLIRTDFRVGIQIAQAADDCNLTDQERSAIMLTLLFGSGIPQDPNIARDGLNWFMSGGMESNRDKSDSDQARSFDFDFDHARLWSGFRRIYHINIGSERIHWFEFLALMADLDGCAFSDVVGYRMADTSKMQPDMRNAYQKMKQQYGIPEERTEEEQSAVDEFMNQLNGCNS